MEVEGICEVCTPPSHSLYLSAVCLCCSCSHFLLSFFLGMFSLFFWQVFAEHTKWFKIKEQKDLKNIFKYIIFHTFLIHPFHTTSPRITGMKKSIPMSWAVGREIPLMDGQFWPAESFKCSFKNRYWQWIFLAHSIFAEISQLHSLYVLKISLLTTIVFCTHYTD